MKVGFLLVVAALVATLAPSLSNCAQTQKQKRETQAVPQPTPTPNSTPAKSTTTSDSSSAESAKQWEERPIKSLSDARRIFEAMDGSLVRMLRDEPDRWGEYFDLKIDKELERRWRGEMITKLSDQLLNPATDAKELSWLYNRLERMCRDQNDGESVLKIYHVTRRIADRLPIEDGIRVAEDINGTGVHTYETGLIHQAVKHGLREVAQDLAGYSMSLAQRAKSGKVEVEWAERTIEKCLAVKRYFSLL